MTHLPSNSLCFLLIENAMPTLIVRVAYAVVTASSIDPIFPKYLGNFIQIINFHWNLVEIQGQVSYGLDIAGTILRSLRKHHYSWKASLFLFSLKMQTTD